MRLVLVILALVVAPAASAQFLYVDFTSQFPGESTDPAHIDWVDAFALAHDITLAGCGGGGGGGGCNPPDFTDVSFLKSTDKATPELHRYAATGQVIPQVTIDVCRPDGGGQFCYYTLELDNVIVTSVSLSSSACLDPATCGGNQTETVTLYFERITWTYNFDNGGKGGSISRCWDLVKGTQC